MKKVTAIIADDEKQLRIHLKNKLSQIWPELKICAEAENGIEAVKVAKKHKPEIAFLDIKMPGKSGLEAAGEINTICRIVFITAYDQYAVDAFENEAIDYILKPVENIRLEKTVSRLKERLEEKNNIANQQEQSIQSENITQILKKISKTISTAKKNKYLQWIKAQHGDSIRLIPVDGITLFKAADKYTAVISKGKEYLIRKTIKELETQLNPEKFWKIHRGTIVKVSSITKVSRSITGRYIIKITEHKEPLTVSRSYIHLFKQM
ncbi:MAG: response regulator transcription factor [Desulfobacterales bacterium]|nr:response regulator transcription factor [Desulfobacterales bacterium]